MFPYSIMVMSEYLSLNLHYQKPLFLQTFALIHNDMKVTESNCKSKEKYPSCWWFYIERFGAHNDGPLYKNG